MSDISVVYKGKKDHRLCRETRKIIIAIHTRQRLEVNLGSNRNTEEQSLSSIIASHKQNQVVSAWLWILQSIGKVP